MSWPTIPGARGSAAPQRGARPAVEALDPRQLPSGLLPAELDAAQAAPTFRIYKAVVQPRAGRLLVTFQNTQGGVDPATTDGAVVLVRLQSPRRFYPLTLVQTPQVAPSVYAPLPTPPVATPLQTVAAQFEAGRPLPRGNYVALVSDQIRDAAGRPLDGEFRGRFPSGDGTPGGDFIANFPTNGFFEYPPRPVRLPRTGPA